MPRTIIIAGMPHSGSSFLADRLHSAGIQMHSAKMCEHYECQELVTLADAEQKRRRCGLDKSGVPRYKPSPEFVLSLKEYRRKRELIKSPLPYGFKEPRITAYLEAYMQVWPDAMYIWAIRNPLTAAFTRIRRIEQDIVRLKRQIRMPNVIELLQDHSAALLYAMRTLNQYQPSVLPYFYSRDTTQEEQVVQETELSGLTGVKIELAAHWSPDCWGKSGGKEY